MKTSKKHEPKTSIIRLSNLKETENISPGLYYFFDFSTEEIYYFDYRKKKVEKKFKNFKEFDKFLKKEFNQ